MTSEDPTVACSSCGRTGPRSGMFGLEPDLLCDACAHGVRKRLQTRVRPAERYHKPIVTGILLAVSVVLFVLTHFVWHRGRDGFPTWLADLYQGPEIWAGEVYRHLTVVFLHGGWWHVAMNGFAFWYLGRVIESAWGPWALLGLVVFTGLCASAGEWILQGGGVGLSGALFGLCGFLWALRRTHPVATAVMHDQMVRWIVMLLVLGVVLSATGALAIGNWAHGFGLASGYLMGLAVKQRQRRLLVPLTSLVAVVLVVASVYVALGTVELTRDGGETSFEVKRSQWRETWLEQQARRGGP